MKVTAIVMAGGKGKRMTLPVEKPLLEVGGKPVVEHVLAALKEAKRVSSLVVAVSNLTPKTASYLEAHSVCILHTLGEDYVADLAYTVKTLDLGTVLVIAADMPLITAEIIDEVLDRFAACGKPSLAVAVPVETKRGLGMGLDYAFEHCGQSVVPAGINMIEGKLIDVGELPQEVYVLDKAEVAVNINTVDELRTARKQFARLRGSGNRG